MTHLKPGDKAPLFQGENQEGKTLALTDFAGRKVILYFYPKDHTPGCTAEACSLRDAREQLAGMGFEVVGISPDSVKTHAGFHAKQRLNFPLISDPDHAIAEAYGVWGEKRFMGRAYLGILRTTFVIDAQGEIERVFDKVRTADHFQQIVESYE